MDNNIIRVGHVFRTNNYSQFKRLDGNRSVLAARVRKIKNSIEENGYVLNPIVVNEHMEVIDGQGRLEAIKLLGLPVDYVIAPGAGLAECVTLNAYTTSWTMRDYIESYCEIGNENYIRLRALLDAFPQLSSQVVTIIASGLTNVPTKAIKTGAFKLTPEIYEEAKHALLVATRFKPLVDRVKGTPLYYYYAIVFAVRMGASEKRIFESMSRADLKPAPNVRIAMDQISDLYNLRLRDPDKRIYLVQIHEKTMASKYGWYNLRFLSRHEEEDEDGEPN